jgi:Domain of unknown function (DUF4276)
MNALVSSFWGEGISDERFLPVIAQRVIETLLKSCAQGEWEIYEPIVLRTKADNFVAQVLDVAQQSMGYSILFVHTDADARSEADKAMPNKIEPATHALLSTNKDLYCHNLVPVVPVVKIENWKLADGDALREALGVSLSDEEMGLNISIEVLEQRGSSKEMLREILRLAKLRSRFAPDLEDLDAALAKKIRLDVLCKLNSFSRFIERLKYRLAEQNIIEKNCRAWIEN